MSALVLLFATLVGSDLHPLLDSARTPVLHFTASASGGKLNVGSFFGAAGNVLHYCSIETDKGDSPDSVALGLAEALIKMGKTDASYRWSNLYAEARGSDVRIGSGFPYSWTPSGTEIGLGIPEAPKSFTAVFQPATNKIRFTWRSGRDAFDGIAFFEGGHYIFELDKMSAVSWGSMLLETAKNFPQDVAIVGIKSGLPSNRAGLRLSSSLVQEELYVIPFSASIVPNWTAWNRSRRDHDIVLEEGRKSIPYPQTNVIDKPDQKPFFQLLKSLNPQSSGGVSRHFLALQPGHKYRVYIRLNTLEMKEGASDTANWSFSAHATINKDPSIEGLSADQFAGTAPLPDGSTGSHAAEMAILGPSATTKGQWTEFRTGNDKGQLSDITIPPGFDSITVWLRVSGQIPNGVGMDWIKLEDVTDKKE